MCSKKDQTDYTQDIVRFQFKNIVGKPSDVKLNYLKSYDDDESCHQEMTVIRMIQVWPDSFLGVCVQLGHKKQTNANKEPIVQIREQEHWIDQQKAPITDKVEPTKYGPHV